MPFIGGTGITNGFLRTAIEDEIDFFAVQFPPAGSSECVEHGDRRPRGDAGAEVHGRGHGAAGDGADHAGERRGALPAAVQRRLHRPGPVRRRGVRRGWVLNTAPLALELSGVTKRFGPTTALDDVSLTVERGRVEAIVGENGAGKSTLLKILAGAVTPTSGEMRLRGEAVDLDRLDPQRAQRLGVSVVHQEFSLLPALTVAENVFIGHEPKRRGFLDRRRMFDDTADLLARLGSAIAPDAPVESLSVASMQIVEIAKALSIDADVVAMDEPSAVLSGPELEQLFAVVARAAARGRRRALCQPPPRRGVPAVRPLHRAQGRSRVGHAARSPT